MNLSKAIKIIQKHKQLLTREKYYSVKEDDEFSKLKKLNEVHTIRTLNLMETYLKDLESIPEKKINEFLKEDLPF